MSDGNKAQYANGDAIKDINTSWALALETQLSPPNVGFVPYTELVTDVTQFGTFLKTSEKVDRVRVAWVEQSGSLDQDFGDEHAENAIVQSVDLDAKRYYKMLSIDEDHLGDPVQRSLVSTWPGNNNTRLIRKKVDLVREFILTGHLTTLGLAYDDQAFFGNHPGVETDGVTPITHSNLITTSALDSTNLRIALNRLYTFTDQKGNQFNQRQTVPAQILNEDTRRVPLAQRQLPFHLIVGPALEQTAKDLCKVSEPSGDFANECSYEVWDEIVLDAGIGMAATDWFVLYRSTDVTPLNEYAETPSFRAFTTPNGETFNWKYRAKFGYGYRGWSTMIRATA